MPQKNSDGSVKIDSKTGKALFNTQVKFSSALEMFSELSGRDSTGKPLYTAAEQYAILKGMGFEKYMKYDSSGTEID